MRKTINGKQYNTACAREIGHTVTGSPGDQNYCYEALYRKRTGEFFLYGKGGPESEYRVVAGISGWTGGERITPLSYEEAESWAEEHLPPEVFQRTFRSSEEGKVITTISLDRKTYDKLSAMSVQSKMSKSAVISILINSVKSDGK